MFPTSKPLLRKLSQICLFSPLLVNRFDAKFSKLGKDSQSVRSISFFKRVSRSKRLSDLLFHRSLSLSRKVVGMRNKVLSKAYKLNTILVSGISRQARDHLYSCRAFVICNGASCIASIARKASSPTSTQQMKCEKE